MASRRDKEFGLANLLLISNFRERLRWDPLVPQSLAEMFNGGRQMALDKSPEIAKQFLKFGTKSTRQVEHGSVTYLTARRCEKSIHSSENPSWDRRSTISFGAIGCPRSWRTLK